MTVAVGAEAAWSDTWSRPVFAAILAVPFAIWLALWLTARRRRAGMHPGWSARSAFAEVAMIVGTAPWIWLILTPNPGHPRGKSLVPFRDLADQFHVGLGYAAIQIGGNLLVFAALGFCLPIRFRVGPAASLAAGLVFSITVEALQWYLRLGRFTSVDDVIVNTTGAFLAAWLSRPWWRRRMWIVVPTEPTENGVRVAGSGTTGATR